MADVDFNVPAGATVALVGPSGAGKTTIANLLLRFWDPEQGRIRLDGIELRGMTEEFAQELRARLAIQEGQRVSHVVRERIGGMALEYGRQLEFSLTKDAEGGAVLRIHPPGSAGEPLVEERKKK